MHNIEIPLHSSTGKLIAVSTYNIRGDNLVPVLSQIVARGMGFSNKLYRNVLWL